MSAMSDSLDEFFDFAQLEQDSSAHDQSSHVEFDEAAFAEDVTAMDWQPVIFDHAQVQGEHQELDTQWPLDGLLDHSLAHNDSNITTYMWPVSDAPLVDDYQQCLNPTPSTSLQSHDNAGLSTDRTCPPVSSLANGIAESSRGAVENSINERPVLQALGYNKSTPSNTTKASLPSRHASSASWKPASAKRKGPQSRIPLESRQILEDEFATNPYPCNWEYDIIAHQANLDVKKVRNWFNNTRARKKGEGNSQQILETCCAYPYIQILVTSLKRDNMETHNLSRQSCQGTA